MNSALAALHSAFDGGLGQVQVDQLNDRLLRVQVPAPQAAHDSITITVEDLPQGGFRITDAGRTEFDFGGEGRELIDILQCAGASLEYEPNLAVHLVDDHDDLAGAILRFAHAINASDLVWNALRCAEASDEPAARAGVSDAKQMARRCRDRIGDVVPRSKPFLRLDHRVAGREETASAPLAFGRTRTSQPELLASFIPKSPKAEDDAKQRNAWLWKIADSLTVPKFVVVADSARVDHYSELFEPENITAIAEDDASSLEAEVAMILERTGLSAGR